MAAVTPVGLVVTGELPRGSPLAKKETEPVGPEPDAGTTVAVSGTAFPKGMLAATELETRAEVAVAGATADEPDLTHVGVVGGGAMEDSREGPGGCSALHEIFGPG